MMKESEMFPIEIRIRQAEKLWEQAEIAESENNLSLAYSFCTEAHDLIMDCARYHQMAHEKLRKINFTMGNYGELATDWLLHVFAPFGVFELVSRFSKTGAFHAIQCKRNDQ